MTLMMDSEPQTAELPAKPTLGDALNWAQARLKGSDKVIVSVKLDGADLAGPALQAEETTAIGERLVEVATEEKSALARRMLGKLAALVEWLAPRHHEIAEKLEQQQRDKAIEQLAGVLSAWQQVQEAFSGLCVLLALPLGRLPVGERSAEDLINEFAGQLQEIQTALENQDMVLLSDVMQYEMDTAVSNWINLLASILGVVDGVVTV